MKIAIGREVERDKKNRKKKKRKKIGIILIFLLLSFGRNYVKGTE